MEPVRRCHDRSAYRRDQCPRGRGDSRLTIAHAPRGRSARPPRRGPSGTPRRAPQARPRSAVIERPRILLQVVQPLGAGEWGRCPLPAPAPRRARAARGCIAWRAPAPRWRHQLHVPREVLTLNRGLLRRQVVRGEVLEPPDLAREKPASQRAVRALKPMPSSRHVGRISSSGRAHSEYSVWSALMGCVAWARRDGGGGRLREAEVADFAGAHQLRHRPTCPRSARSGHAVLVVQVDGDPRQPARATRRRPGRTYSGRRSRRPSSHPSPTKPNLVATATAVAPILDGPAYQLLVGFRAVGVGRIEQGDAEVNGAVDGGDGARRSSCRRRNSDMPMQPSPIARDDQPLGPEGTLCHLILSPY